MEQKMFVLIVVLVTMLAQRITIVTSFDFECPDSECADSPCSCDEINLHCRQQTCNNNPQNGQPGCSQCEDGYFKQSWDHRCVHCETVVGPGCRFCRNGDGCGQCYDGYEMKSDSSCVAGETLYYCQSTDTTLSPAVDCDISDSWVRLIYNSASFNQVSNNWCYNYVLYKRRHLDGEINAICEIEYLSDVSEVSLEFVALDDDLDTYLDLANSVLGDYTIEDNVLVINPSESDGYTYSICVNSSVIGYSVLALVHSDYVLTDNDSRRRLVTSDTTGGITVVPDLTDSTDVGEVPVVSTDEPLPGEKVDLDMIDEVDGNGTFTITSDTLSVHSWWIQSCTTDDGGIMTVELWNQYFDFLSEDEDAYPYEELCQGLRDTPILMPPYDRWGTVLPQGCSTLQGFVENCDNNEETLVITIDTTVSPAVFFDEADFQINTVDFIIMGTDLNTAEDTEAFCTNLETNEETEITTVEGFEAYIATTDESDTIVCYAHSDTSISNAMVASDAQSEPFTANTDDASVIITFGNANASFADSNNTNDTFSLLEFFDIDEIESVDNVPRPTSNQSICWDAVSWGVNHTTYNCQWLFGVKFCMNASVVLDLDLDIDGTIESITEMSTRVFFDYDVAGVATCDDDSITEVTELGTETFYQMSETLIYFAGITFRYQPFMELQFHSSIGAFQIKHAHFSSASIEYEAGFSAYDNDGIDTEGFANLIRFNPYFNESIRDAITVKWPTDKSSCPADYAGEIMLSIIPGVTWTIRDTVKNSFDSVMRAQIDHIFGAQSIFPPTRAYCQNEDRDVPPICFINDSGKERIYIGVEKTITYQLGFSVFVPKIIMYNVNTGENDILINGDEILFESEIITFNGSSNSGCQKKQATFYAGDCCNSTLHPTSQPTPDCLNSECASDPCDCDEPDLHCVETTCHEENGCDQCEDGYWKPDYNHRCLLCGDDPIGEGCKHCTDFLGCNECDEGYTREIKEDCFSGSQNFDGIFYICVED